MNYKNELEARLAKLRYEYLVARMNGWEFDMACIEDEIEWVLEQIEKEDL